VPDDEPNPLDYASTGAGRERLRRRLRSCASLFVQLLAGGLITCGLYLVLLRLVFWIWQKQ
jgi:hypothetical protein